MASLYMLDTNAASHFIRGDRPALTLKFRSTDRQFLCISAITEAELLFGVANKPAATRLGSLVIKFLNEIRSEPWTTLEAQTYADLRAELQRSGKTLSLMDSLIAAHALTLGATLITADKAFLMVDGLTVENWA